MFCTPTSFFKCLADETRLKIILLLAQHDKLCVCDLHETLNEAQPKVSRHLAELRRCEILVTEKHGKWVHYQINPSIPQWAKAIIDDIVSELPTHFPEICPLKSTTDC